MKTFHNFTEKVNFYVFDKSTNLKFDIHADQSKIFSCKRVSVNIINKLKIGKIIPIITLENNNVKC